MRKGFIDRFMGAYRRNGTRDRYEPCIALCTLPRMALKLRKETNVGRTASEGDSHLANSIAAIHCFGHVREFHAHITNAD